MRPKIKTKSKAKSKRIKPFKPKRRQSVQKAIDLTRKNVLLMPVLYKKLLWNTVGYLRGVDLGSYQNLAIQLNNLYDPNTTIGALDPNYGDSNASVKGFNRYARDYELYKVFGCKVTIRVQNVSNCDCVVAVSVSKKSTPDNLEDPQYCFRQPRCMAKTVMRSVAGNKTTYHTFNCYIPINKMAGISKEQFRDTNYGVAYTDTSYIPSSTNAELSSQYGYGLGPLHKERIYLHITAFNVEAGGTVSNVNFFTDLANMAGISNSEAAAADVAQYGSNGANVFSNKASIFYKANLTYYTRFSLRETIEEGDAGHTEDMGTELQNYIEGQVIQSANTSTVD